MDEQCDDGNDIDGDGCTYATCAIEDNFSCTENASGLSTCIHWCGDGKIDYSDVTDPTGGTPKTDYNEECDDNNTNQGDGCDETCHVEEGWECVVSATLGYHKCTELKIDKPKITMTGHDSGKQKITLEFSMAMRQD